MSDLAAIAFLTPTDKDVFTEEKIGDDLYKVTFKESSVVVLAKRNKDAVDLELREPIFKNDYDSKKLMGYVIFKIVTRL